MADIIGFGGKLSGGKTITAVMFMIDDYKKGKKLISNIKLYNVEYTYIESEELATFIMENYKNEEKIKEIFFNGSLLIDEVRNLLSARKSMSNLNEILTQFLMMLGKLDCNFYYTFQIFGSQVDLQLREITHKICECKRVTYEGYEYTGPRIPIIPIKIYFEVWEVVANGLRFTKDRFLYDPSEYYKYYNTREIVIVDREKYKVK